MGFSFNFAVDGSLVYSRISGRVPNGILLAVFLLIAGIASLTMVGVSTSTPYWVLAVAVASRR